MNCYMNSHRDGILAEERPVQKGQSGAGPGAHVGYCDHCGEKGSRRIRRCEVGIETILGKAWKALVRKLDFI